MNWDAIGATGELIGAITVMVTLIYLVIQLKQNTRALKSSTFQQVSNVMAQNWEVIIANPDMAALFLKAASGLKALDEKERFLFGAIATMLFRRVETVYTQEALGAIDARLTAGFKQSCISSLSHAGMREWWQQSQAAFSSEFVLWVNKELEAGVQPIHMGIGR
ncbi:hypothetical protein R0135_01040 [Congregibacter variabilis]|uniref:DUF4760 domain-containing protein n=1 Tax=Congregibacter variabilis TaxID=3081200 RepID=A0ABZ0I401_9GAMM|nr:hypothetical protein R0135_01040 [Congregibacter sp. IMCC43200]